MFGRPYKPTVSKKDRIIQGTDLDALSFKYSAQSKGYLNDIYVQSLVDQIRLESPNDSIVFQTPKLPLINRGTYIRIKSIDTLVDKFIQGIDGPKQIISLGAGSDTRPFQLLEKYPKDLIYHEIDFSVSTERKGKAILSNALIRKVVGNIHEAPLSSPSLDELHTEKYHLHAFDLRDITESTQLFKHMDESAPTLCISECCVCYMEPEAAGRLVKWMTNSFKRQLAMVLYEPMSANDSFGRVMVQNLATRGICLPTVDRYPTLQAQIKRLKQVGFVHIRAADLQFIFDNWVGADELERIQKLEFLDELEELELLLQHYCLVWASRVAIINWEPIPYSERN